MFPPNKGAAADVECSFSFVFFVSAGVKSAPLHLAYCAMSSSVPPLIKIWSSSIIICSFRVRHAAELHR